MDKITNNPMTRILTNSIPKKICQEHLEFLSGRVVADSCNVIKLKIGKLFNNRKYNVWNLKSHNLHSITYTMIEPN